MVTNLAGCGGREVLTTVVAGREVKGRWLCGVGYPGSSALRGDRIEGPRPSDDHGQASWRGESLSA